MFEAEGESMFGIKQLDNITLGSLRNGQMGLIYGPAGSGKTSLAAHFLFKGASSNMNVCLLTTETTSRLANKMSGFKSFDPKWLREGYLSIFRIQDLMDLVGIRFNNIGPGDLDILYDLIIQTLDDMDIKRFIIDPASPLLRVLSEWEKDDFFQKLRSDIYKRGITCMVVLDNESGDFISDFGVAEPHMFDIILRFNKDREDPISLNTLRIERWASSPHSKNTYVVDISEDGVILVPRIKPLEVK